MDTSAGHRKWQKMGGGVWRLQPCGDIDGAHSREIRVQYGARGCQDGQIIGTINESIESISCSKLVRRKLKGRNCKH